MNFAVILGIVLAAIIGYGLYLAFVRKSGSSTPRVDLPANTKPTRPDH